MIGFLILGLVLASVQSQHHQPSLHQRRLNDPNWAVNSPIQPWEKAQQQTNVAQPTWNAQPQQTYVAQPTWNAQPQQTWNAQPQPTWNAQPQQYTAQNSASLHQRRTNDPNWIVNTPIQPWEAAYNGPAPVVKQTYSHHQQTYRQPQATYQQPQVAVHQPHQPLQALPGQRPGNVLWAVKAHNSDPLWATKAKKPSEDPLWALNAHQKSAFLHG